jgi:hypothetical protein
MFPKVMRVRYIRIKVTRSQNSFYKSATTSRVWPLPGTFLIPLALLVVADLVPIFPTGYLRVGFDVPLGEHVAMLISTYNKGIILIK